MRYLLILCSLVMLLSCSVIGANIRHDDNYAAGIAAIGNNQFELAITHLNKTVALEPENLKALYALGFSFMETGDNESALRYYSQAAMLCTDDRQMEAEAFVGMAYVLHRMKKYEQAIDIYNFLLATHPTDSRIRYNRGCALGKNGAPEQAVIDFMKVLEIDPNHSGAKDNLTHYLAKI